MKGRLPISGKGDDIELNAFLGKPSEVFFQGFRDHLRTGEVGGLFPKLYRGAKGPAELAVSAVEGAELGAEGEKIDAQGETKSPRMEGAVDDLLPKGEGLKGA